MADQSVTLTPAQERFLDHYVHPMNKEADPPSGSLEALLASLAFIVFAERRRKRDITLPDILEGSLCQEFLPWSDELAGDQFETVFTRYKSVHSNITALETRLDAMKRDEGLQDIDIDQSLSAWQSDPRKSPEWFGDFVAYSRIARDEPVEEELPNAVVQFLERRPAITIDAPQPSEPAFNTTDKSKIVAPLEVMDAESRIALYGTDNQDVNIQEDFAGTGGIRKISARRLEDDAIEVEIEGEILPGRLPRKPAKKKGGPEPEPKPGQSWAPDLQAVSSWRTLETIPLRNPKDWERLHLWGPGFGDEASAGIYLGPTVVNQAYQNKGIENLIRQVGRLVAPLREHGYRVGCKATVTTWPDPTPAGFSVERVFRSVTYCVTLTYPDAGQAGTLEATASLELLTDPYYVNEGFKPQVRTSADTAAWTALFQRIPESIPAGG